jgi:hypothetical protein
MKNNDEFKIYTNEYDDDARAVTESELLPIYETMSFAGDIQPLEDVATPEYEKIEFANNSKNNRKSNIKKKKALINSVSDIFSKTITKKIVAVLLVAVVLVSTVAGAIFTVNRASVNESSVKAIYKIGKDSRMILTDGEIYSFAESEQVEVSDNGMMVYFSRESSSRTGKFDLRAINVGKKTSLKKGGSFVDNGVDEGWTTNRDGSLLSYSKTKNGIKEFYLYNAEAGKSELIANDVEDVFLPTTGDVVYFTRRIGQVYSLHRTRFGEDPTNVASEINYVNFCDSDEGFEVIYTAQTGNGLNVDVFLVTEDKSPVTVYKDVSEVYANSYTYKGNLYFFKKNTGTVNWQDFINDTYFDSDVTMQKPLEGDYMKEVGFIFKRYVLDTASYNAALRKYKAKEKRDLIREELNKIDLGLAAEDDYTCYVYNGMTTKKLASDILLESVLVFAESGAPRLVYAKSVIGVENKITMDKLVEIADESDVSDVADFVIDAIKDSYKLSDECIYTWYDGSKVLEYSVKGYEPDKTKFVLGGNKNLFALKNGELFRNEISSAEIGEAVSIDKEVADCAWLDGYLYYTKSGATDTVNLLRYSSDEGKEDVDVNLYTYLQCDKDCIFLLKNIAGTDLMNIRMYSNGAYTEVDSNVSFNSFRYNGKNIAYLKNVGAADTHNAGEMYVYSHEKGAEKCEDGVTEIIFVNES